MAFRYPLPFPPQGLALGFLALLYLLPGLIGHDPWKSDDVIQIATVAAMLKDGPWIDPLLPGLKHIHHAPLPLWFGALFAKYLPFLTMHNAVRLASGAAGGLMLLFLNRAARNLNTAAEGPAAALIAIGCLGLLPHIHEAQPAIFLLAALSAFLWGMSTLPRQPVAAGAITGAAAGAAFLSAGLLGLALTLPLLFLPLILPAWRRPEILRGTFLGLGLALLLSAMWPLALFANAPATLSSWWHNEAARFSVYPEGPWANLADYLELLSWFAWPALPLALWTLWRYRRKAFPFALTLPLAAFLLVALLAVPFLPAGNTAALPFLPPLILLAAPAAGNLRRGAANAFDWFAMMTFSLMAFLVWLGWLAMTAGIPAQIARNIARLLPGFQMDVQPLAVTAAALLTLAWLALIFASPRRSPWRGTNHWAAGVILLWSLTIALWLPAIDYGRTYRAMSSDLATHLRPGDCIESRGVGASQIASFYYFSGIIVQEKETATPASCNLLLVQSTRGSKGAGPGWRQVWEGRRPSDRHERFRLYARIAPHQQ